MVHTKQRKEWYPMRYDAKVKKRRIKRFTKVVCECQSPTGRRLMVTYRVRDGFTTLQYGRRALHIPEFAYHRLRSYLAGYVSTQFVAAWSDTFPSNIARPIVEAIEIHELFLAQIGDDDAIITVAQLNEWRTQQ